MSPSNSPHAVEVLMMAHMLATDAETARLTERLSGEGIQSILLKGPAFVDWLYADGTFRSYGDIDLLVPPARWEHVQTLVEGLGYRDVYSPLNHPGLTSEVARNWRRGTLEVDLHRSLDGVRVDPERAWAAFSAGTETLVVGGRPVQTLGTAGRMVLVALHAAHHGHEGRKPLLDLARALAQVETEHWRPAVDLARSLDALPAFAAGLRLAPGGSELIERFGLADAWSIHTELGLRHVPLARGFEELRQRSTLKARAALLGRELAPTPQFMRWWSPMARSGPVGLVLAYLMRPVWLAYRALPGFVAWRRATRPPVGASALPLRDDAASQVDHDDALDVSVLVPSFRRPDYLERCVRAIARQTVAPARVVVVARTDDEATLDRCRALRREVPLSVVTVEASGQVVALNAGLRAVDTPLVAITDDDCEPRPGWIEAVRARFATDHRIGAVGGRDIVHKDGVIDDGAVERVGRIRWFGKHVGFHHLSAPLQDVQFLKGANMAFRTELAGPIDERLKGEGAQVANDMHASLAVWRRGFRVVYDPGVVVDHHPAPRFDADRRDARSRRAMWAEHHNDIYVLLSLLPRWYKISVLTYRVLVGTRAAPGPLLAILALKDGGPEARKALGVLAPVTRGRLAGARTYLRTRGERADPAKVAGVAPQ